MEKVWDEKSDKDPDKSENEFGSGDRGSSKDQQSRLSSGSDSIHVLEMHDSCFVADTVEDDDSLIIPPTPDIVIPSTQEFTYEEKNTSVISIDETCIEDIKASKPSHDVITLEADEDEDAMNDMTQDIPELDATQELLPAHKKSLPKNTECEPEEEDDDWQLKFSETQETQELLSTTRMRAEREKMLSSSRDSSEKKEESPLKESNLLNPTPSKLEEIEQSITKSPRGLFEREIDSEDEIEPSQSCLIDYQKSSTYNAFRDELLQNSLNIRCSASTPDVQKNGKSDSPCSESKSDVLLVPDSPKGNRLSLSNTDTKEEHKQSTDTIDITSEDANNDKKYKLDSDIIELTPSCKLGEEPLCAKVDTWVVGKKEMEKSKNKISEEEQAVVTALNINEPKDVRSKDVTVVDLVDSKDVTMSDLGDSKDISVSDLGDPKDVPVSGDGDPKDVTMPDLVKSKGVTIPSIGDPKVDVSSDVKDSKDVTLTDSIDLKDADKTMSDLDDDKDIMVPDFKDSNYKAELDVSNSEVKKDVKASSLSNSEDVTMTDSDGPKNTTTLDLNTSKLTTTAENKDIKNTDTNVAKDNDATSSKEKLVPLSDSTKSNRELELSFECSAVPVSASTPCEDNKVIDSKLKGMAEVLKEDNRSATPVIRMVGILLKSALSFESALSLKKPQNKLCTITKHNTTSSEHENEDDTLSPGAKYSNSTEALFTKPLVQQQRMRLSRKQRVQFQAERPSHISVPFERGGKQLKLLGSFKDAKTLEQIFSSCNMSLEQQHSELLLNLKPKEELKLSAVLLVKENKVYIEGALQIFTSGTQKNDLAGSPHSSGSLTTTSSIGSLQSGEIADISSSSSAKSGNSSAIHLDHSIPLTQEHKTSTQESAQPSDFSNFFVVKKAETNDDSSSAKMPISPIESNKRKKTVAAKGRKRVGKNATTSPTSSSENNSHRKRGRYTKELETPENKSESEKGCLTTDEVKPTKTTRGRKKTAAKEPPQESPRPEVREVPQKTEIDDDGSLAGNILPGVRVMARWTDGYYYPGEVRSQVKDGRWSVCFDDGNVKAISQESLIKASLIQQGTSILVQSPESYFDSGIVRGHFRDGDIVGYEIELDTGITKRYPRTAVVLSSDQAKLIINSRPPTTPATMTINLDNIIEGKRKRKSQQSAPPAPDSKKPCRTSRRGVAKADSHCDTSAESTTERTVGQEEDVSSEKESTKPNRRPTRKRKAAITATEKAKLSTQKKHPKLFKDYAFLLTNTERKPVAKVEPTSDSEILTEEESIKPFDKDELVMCILSRGGMVLDKFDDIKKCSRPNIYLLANTYLRTMKYIQCLASAIPCIKHHWVQDCCKMDEILNVKNYVLQTGMSLIENQAVEWHGKADILKGMKISLVSAPGHDFVENWTPVLLAAKADFVQKSLPSSKSGASAYVNLVITNSVCPQEIIQSAKKNKIPIVSIEWLIQSLIAGKSLKYNEHPKFKHDYTE